MSLHTILVVNNAPGCNTEIEQQITVTGCTTYIVRLASNSNALGPFSIYVDASLYGSGYTRTDMFNGVVISLECATPTPTPTPSTTPGVSPTPTQTPTATALVPNPIVVNGYYFSGSIGAGYSATATYVVDTNVDVYFDATLQTTTGSPITQNVMVTIPQGQISGFTQTFIQGLYVDLTQTAQLSGFTAVIDSGTTYDYLPDSGTTQFDVTPTPTPSITPSPTPTVTNTITPTQTATNTATPTPSVTNTATPTQTATAGVTPTPTPSITPSETPTNTPTATTTPSVTPSETPTQTPTLSPGASPLPTSSPTPTNTETPTQTPTNTATLTPTNTASETPTQTPTQSETPTQTPSVTPTLTPTNTASQTPSETATPTQTPTNTETPTQTPSETPTQTPTLSPGATPSQTPSNTATPTVTPTVTPSETPTQTPSETPTLTPTNTASQTPTNTPTPTETPTQTPSETPTLTPTNTITQTPTTTQTPSVTPSETPTNTPTTTETPTQTPSGTPTPTPTKPLLPAYLFIEPTSANTQFAGWMASQGSPSVFRGFSNGFAISTNPVTFDQQMNIYIQYSGWGGNAPAIGTGITSTVSGGNDIYGNPITAYLFQTYKVDAGTVAGNAWYTWIIPTGSTNGQKLSQIGFNNSSNPNALTAANMQSSVYNLSITTTGSTLPIGVYRVYTTYTNPTMRFNGSVNDIYFKGNALTP